MTQKKNGYFPGIDFSPDRMLQGRIFNYGDTQRYRLGINSGQLPVNSPFQVSKTLEIYETFLLPPNGL